MIAGHLHPLPSWIWACLEEHLVELLLSMSGRRTTVSSLQRSSVMRCCSPERRVAVQFARTVRRCWSVALALLEQAGDGSAWVSSLWRWSSSCCRRVHSLNGDTFAGPLRGWFFVGIPWRWGRWQHQAGPWQGGVSALCVQVSTAQRTAVQIAVKEGAGQRDRAPGPH